VRLVPSRDDRLPFCSIVLSAPFERGASAGARKMADCYDFFVAEAHAQLSRELARLDEDADLDMAAATEAEAAHAASSYHVHPPCTAPMVSQLELLAKLVEGATRRISVVVFELEDGVALQNMYDMLAQRERLLNGFFANVGGRTMAQGDLVRNMLLGHIGDEDERLQAYDEHWRPMERAQGDGEPAALERYLRSFLLSELPPVEGAKLEGEGGRGVATSSPSTLSLLEGFGFLVRVRGGTSGAISLQEAGTDAADAQMVSTDAAKCAVLGLLRQMHAKAV
jgi:hypothetical protein